MTLLSPKPVAENETADVVELLLDCHQRIRFFTELAHHLGEADGLPDDEVQGAAFRVRRYFTEALPLHVADEEESVTPGLRGREPELDAALERMTAEHRRHEPLLTELVATCEALEAAPDHHADLRAPLVETAVALAEEFEAHLGEEERVIIPALQRLVPADVRAALADEVRARRHRAWQR